MGSSRRVFGLIALIALWLIGVLGCRYAVYRTCTENLRSCDQFHGGLFHGARAPWDGFGTYDRALDDRLRVAGGSAYDTRDYETSLLEVTALTLFIGTCGFFISHRRRHRRSEAERSQASPHKRER